MEQLQDVKDMVHDYFGITVPDDFLLAVIESDTEILSEVLAGAETDTYVRDLIINAITSKLGISVGVTNMFGQANSSNWPCYGDSDEYSKEFHRQLSDKLTELKVEQ